MNTRTPPPADAVDIAGALAWARTQIDQMDARVLLRRLAQRQRGGRVLAPGLGREALVTHRGGRRALLLEGGEGVVPHRRGLADIVALQLGHRVQRRAQQVGRAAWRKELRSDREATYEALPADAPEVARVQ